MSFYHSESYRVALKQILEARKKQSHGHWNSQRLAEHIGVHKSYLSAVLAGRSHLNSDQLYLAIEALKLDTRESTFLNLLLEWERSSVESRRKTLSAQIEKLRHQATSVHAQLEKLSIIESTNDHILYYLEPMHQIVHIALSIDRYAKNLDLLREPFGLSADKLSSIVTNLVKMDLAEPNGKGRFKFKGRNLHLPNDNPLFRGYQRALRQILIERLGENNQEVSFSAFFSVDAKSYQMIRAKWLEAIKELQSDVGRAPAEEIYQINLDMVKWA